VDATEVTLGAEARGSIDAGPFRVSIASFQPELFLPSHYHEWACVSVLLEGRFEQGFSGRSCDCPPGVVLSKPPGERHADRWFGSLSRHLIVEIDPERQAELGPSRPVTEQIFHVGDIGAETIAWAAWREFTEADVVTPVVLEGLVLQLLALVQRRTVANTELAAGPGWLRTVHDFLHDNYRRSVTLSEVAAVAGFHSDHVSRVFAATFDVTVGEYVRRLRVDAAAVRLATSAESISAIAYQTGFSDQSHLTRVFKRLMGVTPGRYRALHGQSDPSARGQRR